MVFRADGGLYITNQLGTAPYDSLLLINTVTGAYLDASGMWVNASSMSDKENIVAVDGREILEKLALLPISKWQNSRDKSDRGHIGPTGEDFGRIFELGRDNHSISTGDPSGIALAAIQELYRFQKESEAKSEKIADLDQKVSDLDNEIRQLRILLDRFLANQGEK